MFFFECQSLKRAAPMHGYYGARIIENQNKRLLYSKCVPDIEMDHNSRRLCKTRTGWRRIVDGKMRIKITETLVQGAFCLNFLLFRFVRLAVDSHRIRWV